VDVMDIQEIQDTNEECNEDLILSEDPPVKVTISEFEKKITCGRLMPN
jgi:hypothetical protein